MNIYIICINSHFYNVIKEYINLNIFKLNNIEKIIISNNYSNIEQIKQNDLVFPIFEHDMIYISDRLIDCLMPKIEIVQIFRNKKLFYEYCKKYDLIEYYPEQYFNMQDLLLSNNKKYILKLDISEYGNGSLILDKNDIHDDLFNKYLIQEYIECKYEYVSHIVAKD